VIGVASIGSRRGRLLLASGSSLDYGHLVLATGARNRLLDLPNANLSDVRICASSTRARDYGSASARRRVSWMIGRVLLVWPRHRPAQRQGGSRSCDRTRTRVMARAVTAENFGIFPGAAYRGGYPYPSGVQATSIESDGANIAGVSLSDGRNLPADLVVVGVGVLPNVELAAEAGLPVAAGIIVNEQLLTADSTSRPSAIVRCFAVHASAARCGWNPCRTPPINARCVAARLTGDARPMTACRGSGATRARQAADRRTHDRI